MLHHEQPFGVHSKKFCILFFRSLFVKTHTHTFIYLLYKFLIITFSTEKAEQQKYELSGIDTFECEKASDGVSESVSE